MTKSFFEFGDTPLKETKEEKKETTSQKLNTDELLNKYSKMDKNSLKAELFSEVEKQKANGTFDAQKLENAVDGFSAFLTKEQIANIKNTINKLK